jgi:hypothetical protein
MANSDRRAVPKRVARRRISLSTIYTLIGLWAGLLALVSNTPLFQLFQLPSAFGPGFILSVGLIFVAMGQLQRRTTRR